MVQGESENRSIHINTDQDVLKCYENILVNSSQKKRDELSVDG